MRWDIFCKVIDNYGDIGVCWRLARQLANEHQQQVRLWVDDLSVLIRIWPEAQLNDQQTIAGVEVCRWPADFPADVAIANIVIEAFACDIPATYLQRMAEQKKAGPASPLWINLEYLSAEDWVEECHGMESVHPSTGLRKTFFFPGFTEKTGGLLREQELIAQQTRFDKQLFLKEIGIQKQDSALLVSLFAYENPAVASLLTTWIESPTPIHCLVPQGKILTSINQALNTSIQEGKPWSQGNLRLESIPFLTQLQYDSLLWSCDINFVRGEDSFVRAQWARKPFIWHIYPQDEEAHMIKLDAFLQRFLTDTNTDLADKISEIWKNWNENGDINQAWSQLVSRLPDWQTLTCNWQQKLTKQPDLAHQLLSLAAKPAA